MCTFNRLEDSKKKKLLNVKELKNKIKSDNKKKVNIQSYISKF